MEKELNTPKVIACPSDGATVRSTDWLPTTTGLPGIGKRTPNTREGIIDAGLLNDATGKENISYFIGVDADETRPQSLLTGDRNIKNPPAQGTIGNSPTMDFIDPNFATGVPTQPSPNVNSTWTPTIHNKNGNIGIGDGSVSQVTDQGFQKQVQASWQGGTLRNRLQMPKAP